MWGCPCGAATATPTARGMMPTQHQVWEFDTSGYLHLPSVLSSPEAARFARAATRRRQTEWGSRERRRQDELLAGLESHPAVVELLNGLCFQPQEYHLGEEDEANAYKLDSPLALLRPAEADAPLVGGVGADGKLDRRTDYAGVRNCHGVQVIWALTDVDAPHVVFVPGSHRPGLPTPPAVRQRGGELAEELQLTASPRLAAGDVLLCASGLMRTIRPLAAGEPPLLLGCEYIAAMARHSPAFRRPLLAHERAPPSFWGELSPAQRALMGADDNSGSLVAEGEAHPSAHALLPQPESQVSALEMWQWVSVHKPSVACPAQNHVPVARRTWAAGCSSRG